MTTNAILKIVMLCAICAAMMISGCIDEKPLREEVAYPILIEFDQLDMRILLNQGGVAEFWKDDDVMNSEWKIVHEEPDKLVFFVSTNSQCLFIYRVFDPEISSSCNDLVIKRDGTAKLGNSKDDFWASGTWK